MNIDRVRNIIKLAFEEDLGVGDVTTNLFVAPDEMAEAVITVKQRGIVCGLDVAEEVFMLSMVQCGGRREELSFVRNVEDGAEVNAGCAVAEVSGIARAILMGERTALNFMQRLSGIATLTGKYVEEVEKVSGKTGIFDTRKTTPALRYFEKYAVKCGGGNNHRMGLWDMVLVKDNHLKMPGSKDILSRLKEKLPEKMLVEVEVRDLNELKETLDKDVDIVMLDNMSISELKKAVKLVNGKCAIEVSGMVDIKNIREIAKLGVERISVGALTHSVKALDISLDIKTKIKK